MNLPLLIGIGLVGVVIAVVIVSVVMKKNKSLSGGGYVMLYQDSCPHCTTLKPLVEQASSETGQTVELWEANEKIDFCRANGIDRVPMLLKLDGDKIVEKYEGNNDLASIKNFLK